MLAAALLCQGLAWAQAAPDDAQQQRRQAERADAVRRQLVPGADVRLSGPAAEAPLRLPQAEAPCFSIREVSFRNADDPALSGLAAALAGPAGDDPPQGRCLGAQGVNLLLRRAQDAAIGRGLVTTRVLAEPQDLSTGRLVLTVVPGRLQAVRLAPGSGSRAGLASALPLAPGELLNLRAIEQGLENLRRLPSVQADIRIEPGAQPGASDLVVAWQQPRPFRASLSLDDSGTRATGRLQASATLAMDNALTLNDLFYVSLNQDAEDAGQRLGTSGHAVHWSAPWGRWQLALNAGRSAYHQTVAGANADIVYSGRSDSADAKLSRLLWRDGRGKATGWVRAFMRRSRNHIDDVEVQVQRRAVGGYELGIAQRLQVGAALLDGQATWKKGTGAFGAQPAPEQDTGLGTSRFSLLALDLSVQTPFTLGSTGFSYSGQWRLQAPQTALSPQERFAIGGRYTVRGFDGERSLAAERGWLLRNELAVALPKAAAQAYAALDLGRVGGPSAAALPGRMLAGAALGLRGSIEWGTTWQYDLQVGAPIHRPAGFDTARTSAGFMLSVAL